MHGAVDLPVEFSEGLRICGVGLQTLEVVLLELRLDVGQPA
jgi:hypothetical protein